MKLSQFKATMKSLVRESFTAALRNGVEMTEQQAVDLKNARVEGLGKN